MAQYTLYYLYKKQRSSDGTDWEDVMPNELSYDGDGTMTPVVVEQDSTECGYDCPQLQRWVDLPISDGYICSGTTMHTRQRLFLSDNCGLSYYPTSTYRIGSPYEENAAECGGGITMYRWTLDGFMCQGYDKYERYKRQVSQDNGGSWQDVEPAEYQKGSLIETNSEDCGWSPQPQPIYEWRNMDIDTDWICDENEVSGDVYYKWGVSGTMCTCNYKYDKETYQYSNGDGEWANVEPLVYRKGKYLNDRCDYLDPDGVGNFKVRYALENGVIGEVPCDSNSTLNAIDYPSILTDAIVGDCVTKLGDRCFMGYPIASVTLSNNITSFGSSCFQDCTSLSGITIPSGVTEIGFDCFNGCTSLTRITIPNSVTLIGDEAFSGCTSLTGITIPSGVTYLNENVFKACNGLTEIVIPNTVKYIDGYCFSGCTSLTGVTIPDSVLIIGISAFKDCTSMTELNIGNGVTDISGYAFSNCSSLSFITINAITPPSISQNTFENTNDCPIYVPPQSVDAYKAAQYWATIYHRIQPIP